MPEIEKLIQSINAESGDYEAKTQLLNLLINILRRLKGKISRKDAETINAFTLTELKRLVPAVQNKIDANAPYKEKNVLFEYRDILLSLFMISSGGPQNVKQDEIELIDSLNELIRKETVVENAVIKLFDHSTIVKSDVDVFVKSVEYIYDIYQIGIIYSGLFHYREKIAKFEADAKTALADFIVKNINSVLERDADEDVLLLLEYAADICVYFPCNEIINLLQRILKTQFNRPRYYAVDSLLTLKAPVDKSTVCELANDPSVASLLYSCLAKHGKLDLYPKELINEEYLAKSDLINWLSYPTELGKMPNEIELIGKAKIKKAIYHIFKYTSDSDTLTDDLKNKWLIGWSCIEDGGTFSNFDKLSDYEKNTPEKTVKYITKKLIK